jgi:segregation and condensation protein A
MYNFAAMANYSPATDEGYRIITEVYEGPLDLLLDLIEKAQLDITKLALAQVTDQYLEYLHNLEERNPSEVSTFLVVAAKLLQIKSAALLPRPTVIPGYGEDEIDAGEELARQLILYRRFKQIAQYFEQREQQNLHSYLRVAPASIKIEPHVDLTGITLEDLLQAARDIFYSRQTQEDLSTVVSLPRITIRDKIHIIRNYLMQQSHGQFSKLLSSANRVEIVVTFLALLELVKRHYIHASQEQIFGEIEFETVANWNDISDEELDLVE